MKKLSYTIYWLLQCTWGLIMTFIGAVAALGAIILGYKPQKFGPNIYFKIGHYWGGVSFGPFFFCCEESRESTLSHESGHSVQNIILGPLFPFIVAIPSAIRYWLRELAPDRIKKSLFNLYLLLSALIVTTLCACMTGLLFHWHYVTIFFELLRMYFLCVSIWLASIEIPRYDHGEVDYYSIWFEKQANEFGNKYFK